MSSLSSFSHKHDQKLKSVVVVEEGKETMNNPEQKSPQEIVSERTILERPSFGSDVVRMDNKNHYCDLCPKVFLNRYALSGHKASHRKERELKEQRKMIDSMHSDDTHRVPYMYQRLSMGPFGYGGWGSSSNNAYPYSNGGGVTAMRTTMFPPPTLDRFLPGNTSYSSSSSRYHLPYNTYSSHALRTDDINLDLTLGISNKSTGGSNNSVNYNANSPFSGEVTRGTTNLTTPVRSHVSRFNFVAGSPLDSLPRYVPPFRNTNLCHDLFSLQEGTSDAKSHISMENFKAMVPPFASLHRTTHLCNDLFSLQENGSGSSHSKSLISKGKNKAMVPPFDPPHQTTHLCDDLFGLQENGSGSSDAKSLISMGENKAMVPPFAPSHRTTHLYNELQENGSGSSHSKSVISKGEKRVMVPEDDDKDIGMIRWMTKKKRSWLSL